jgi:predicted nucleotidyltransferase
MKEFISAFKNTSYYQRLLDSSEVLCIHLGGSMATGITDERSDYDLIIVTLDGDYIDASKWEYLMYKGKKVHWYYRSIKHFFDSSHKDIKAYGGTIILRNLRDDIIIYENPKYINILHRFYQIKDKIGQLGIYCLFKAQDNYINNVLREGKVLEKYYTKYLYHLCLSSYYLLNEEPDKDFLRILKRIRWQPVSEEYKQLAIERLKIYKNYIESHPIDLDRALNDLYSELRI